MQRLRMVRMPLLGIRMASQHEKLCMPVTGVSTHRTRNICYLRF